jgi:hypothetical protein
MDITICSITLIVASASLEPASALSAGSLIAGIMLSLAWVWPQMTAAGEKSIKIRIDGAVQVEREGWLRELEGWKREREIWERERARLEARVADLEAILWNRPNILPGSATSSGGGPAQ